MLDYLREMQAALIRLVRIVAREDFRTSDFWIPVQKRNTQWRRLQTYSLYVLDRRNVAALNHGVMGISSGIGNSRWSRGLRVQYLLRLTSC